jgi:hypothetical protein
MPRSYRDGDTVMHDVTGDRVNWKRKIRVTVDRPGPKAYGCKRGELYTFDAMVSYEHMHRFL